MNPTLLQLLQIGRWLIALIGLFIVFRTVNSAIKAFITPRATDTWLTRAIFAAVFAIFRFRVRNQTYQERDRIMAFFAPITLFLYPFVMLVLILIGYMFIYWALGLDSLYEVFKLSGSSLLTLGYASQESVIFKIFEFSQAMLGLILVALLIAYLPTMYAAFSRRETNVALLESYAGTPPTLAEFIARSHRNNELTQLRPVWTDWQLWFAELEESHTSLAPLSFFRSTQPEQSWVTAAGVVLDTASFMLAAVNIPFEPKAAFLVRTGYIALNRIAQFFQVDFVDAPDQDATISVSKNEFLDVFDMLRSQGVPMVTDREQAWQDFHGWRINYDTALLSLAALTMAPYAQWISDRSAIR